MDSLKDTLRAFGTYDFFGYITPGATLIINVSIFEHIFDHVLPSSKPITPIWLLLSNPQSSEVGKHFIFVYLIAIVLFVYVTGHIISSVSSLFLDRIYIGKGIGYPYETLLGLPPIRPRRPDSSGFYRGFFFWVNLYLVLRFTGFFVIADGESRLFFGFTRDQFYLAARMVGWLIIATLLLKFLTSNIYRQYGKVRKLVQESTVLTRIAHIVKFYLSSIWPLFSDLPVKAVEAHTRTARPFPKDFQNLYRQHFEGEFLENPEKAGSNNFWLCKLYLAKNEPTFNASLNYWLNIYTYARNLSTAFYLSFLYSVLFVYAQYVTVPIAERSGFASVEAIVGVSQIEGLEFLTLLPLLFLFLAFILAIRYKYVYVGHYNRFIFRAFVFLKRSDQSSRLPAS